MAAHEVLNETIIFLNIPIRDVGWRLYVLLEGKRSRWHVYVSHLSSHFRSLLGEVGRCQPFPALWMGMSLPGLGNCFLPRPWESFVLTGAPTPPNSLVFSKRCLSLLSFFGTHLLESQLLSSSVGITIVNSTEWCKEWRMWLRHIPSKGPSMAATLSSWRSAPL